MKSNYSLPLWTILSLLGVIFILSPAQVGSAQDDDRLPATEEMHVIIVAGDKETPTHIPAPFSAAEIATRSQAPEAVPININYNPASCGGPISAWPAAARTAFEYAVDIWSLLFESGVIISIDACWRQDSTGALGWAGPSDYYRNFNGAVPNRWYPVALANQITGGDLNAGTAEISANFDATQTWYFGIDGQTPSSQFDLVSVALHEIGHGLGVSGSMRFDDGTGSNECNGGIFGTGCYGWSNSAMIYDGFLENGAGQNLILTYGNNTGALGTQLISNDLYFNGPATTAANNNNPAKIFAPNPFNPGSSISHLDDATFSGTFHALMTPTISSGESNHYPGAVALGILDDMGWGVMDFSHVYVDSQASGVEHGTQADPFDTLIEGYQAAGNYGVIHMAAGSYAEAFLLQRPLTIQSTGGSVIIGN
ncbi:MAG: hypothetical protein KDE48_20290 [Anaerolineales bacterium]|nr:hypothetical protein [Anaerolineales bacterium]